MTDRIIPKLDIESVDLYELFEPISATDEIVIQGIIHKHAKKMADKYVSNEMEIEYPYLWGRKSEEPFKPLDLCIVSKLEDAVLCRLSLTHDMESILANYKDDGFADDLSLAGRLKEISHAYRQFADKIDAVLSK